MSIAMKWLLIPVLWAPACSKEGPEQPLTEYTIPKEAADYLMMLPNNYFIYRDSASGQLDSVVVETCRKERLYQPPHTVWTGSPLFGHEETIPGYHYEGYTLALRSHTTGLIWQNGYSNDQWYTTGPTTSDGLTVLVFGNVPLGDALTWSGTIFQYPPPLPLRAYIGSFNVEGRTYNNVLLADCDGQLFYWAKGVGIIKRVIQKGGRTFTSTLVRRGSV